MNTVDCIRKFGWEWARESYFFIEEHKHIASSIDFIYQNQLKRYIDAYDLVQSYGSLKECKEHFRMLSDDMKQAIQLVEEVGSE